MKHAILGALAAASLFALAAPATAQTTQEEADESLANPSSAFRDSFGRGSWHTKVEATDRGHMIGDPDAEASLIEFISYTCSHCADFARQGDPALELMLLAPGRMNVEVRPVIRNAIDLTVSLLVQCGDPDGFKDRHRMFLSRQDTWLTKAQNAPQSQQAIWMRGDRASRINAASALGLDDILADRGTSRTEINTCLSDDQAALALIRNGNADREEFGVRGTPSFALDGEFLTDVHNWAALSPVLQEHFRPKGEE